MNTISIQKKGVPAAAIEFESVLQGAIDELDFANTFFPQFHSMHEGYAIILKELDEAWIEIKNNKKKAAYREMEQTCAMCLKFLVAFRRYRFEE